MFVYVCTSYLFPFGNILAVLIQVFRSVTLFLLSVFNVFSMCVSSCVLSDIYEPEGNACSVTDSTAEEHVLALVEHAADEARDRINRFMPNSKVLYHSVSENGIIPMNSLANTLANILPFHPADWLPKERGRRAHLHGCQSAGTGCRRCCGHADLTHQYLLNKSFAFALHLSSTSPQFHPCNCLLSEEEVHPVDLSSLSNKLLPGLTALGFKDDRRHKGKRTWKCMWVTQGLRVACTGPSHECR